MNDTVLPDTVDLLIALLDKTYPLQNFAPGLDAVTIHRKCGQRDVVEFILILQKERSAPEE